MLDAAPHDEPDVAVIPHIVYQTGPTALLDRIRELSVQNRRCVSEFGCGHSRGRGRDRGRGCGRGRYGRSRGCDPVADIMTAEVIASRAVGGSHAHAQFIAVFCLVCQRHLIDSDNHHDHRLLHKINHSQRRRSLRAVLASVSRFLPNDTVFKFYDDDAEDASMRELSALLEAEGIVDGAYEAYVPPSRSCYAPPHLVHLQLQSQSVTAQLAHVIKVNVKTGR